MTCFPKLLGDLKVGLAFRGTGALRGEDGYKTFQLSPRLKHKKLFLDLNFGDPKTVAAQWYNQMVRCEALQCLPYWSATESG